MVGESIETFDRVIKYLRETWSDREVEDFTQATFRVIYFISEYPRMFRKTNIKNVHEALITPHNLLVYEIHSNHITLITFRDTRQHPSRKKK
jgi:hypothetical protein